MLDFGYYLDREGTLRIVAAPNAYRYAMTLADGDAYRAGVLSQSEAEEYFRRGHDLVLKHATPGYTFADYKVLQGFFCNAMQPRYGERLPAD